MEVIIVDSLSSYLELISDLRLSLADVVSKLKSNDEWWASYLEKYPPRFFSDIGKASYVKSYYDFIDQESEDSNLIFLEEPEEELRILLNLPPPFAPNGDYKCCSI